MQFATISCWHESRALVASAHSDERSGQTFESVKRRPPPPPVEASRHPLEIQIVEVLALEGAVDAVGEQIGELLGTRFANNVFRLASPGLSLPDPPTLNWRNAPKNVTLDAHAIIKRLTATGINAEQAEAIFETIARSDTEPVTKGGLRADLIQWLTLRIVTIAAIINGILFAAALRYLPPAT